jgi:hypothetical protein
VGVNGNKNRAFAAHSSRVAVLKRAINSIRTLCSSIVIPSSWKQNKSSVIINRGHNKESRRKGNEMNNKNSYFSCSKKKHGKHFVSYVGTEAVRQPVPCDLPDASAL